ncbi:MAG: tape measure protein [Prevotella sp.]|nr:tape measure protein [Prevotella sp.]
MGDLKPLAFSVGIKDNTKKKLGEIEKRLNALKDKTITIAIAGGSDKELAENLTAATEAFKELKNAVGTGKPLNTIAKKATKAQEAIDKLSTSLKTLGSTITGNEELNQFVSGLGNIIRAVNADLRELKSPGAFKGFAKEAKDAAASANKAEIEIAKLTVLQNRMRDTVTSAQKVSLDTTDLEKAIQKIETIKNELRNIKAGGGVSPSSLTTSKYMGSADVQIAIMGAKQDMSDLSAKTREIERLEAEARRANEQLGRMKKTTDEVNEAFRNSIPSVSSFKRALASVGGVYVFQQLARDVIRVRGEMEQMEVAITSLVGSQAKADVLIKDLKDFARMSPLTIKDLMEATQTMIGFGVEVEKIPRFIRALGDVTLGNSERFKSITLAFSQMTAAGRLMGQDNLQFINAGFNPLMYIAEKTGKTMKELRDEMQKGAISTKMVEDAFISATEAGGRFYQMSEKTSQTVAGQMNKLRDSIYRSLNDFGEKNEGVIMDSIKGTTYLIDNYEQVGRVLVGLVVSYGTYRTAVILATAAENGHTLAMSIARLRIFATQKAQALLNATMLTNPYVAAATALGVLVGTLIATSDGLSASERAQKNFNDAMKEASDRQKEYNQQTENAITTANSDTAATDQRREALNLLIGRYPSIIQKYIDEKGHLKDILALKKEIAIMDGNTSLEDLNRKTQRYRDTADITKRIIKSGVQGLTPEEIALYNQVKQEYFDSNNWSAKAWYNENDLVAWANQMAGNYGKKAQRQAAENATKRFQDTITNMTDAQLKSLQETLQRAKDKKKNVLIRGYQDLQNVTLSPDDISSLITYTGGIVSARQGSIRDKAKIEEEKKAAQATLDALSIAEANGKKGVELRKKIAGYNKELEAYSASKSARSDAKEDAANTKAGEGAERLTGEKMKQALAAERARVDLLHSTRAAEIGAMEESTWKTLAQIELDRERKLEAIKREYEDLRVTRIENAKKLWDADPNNKGNNFYVSDSYRNAASDSSYTEAEKNNRIQKEREVVAEYIRGIREVNEAETKAMTDYLKNFGSVEQMKLAIRREYNAKIAREDDEWKKRSLAAERDKAIDNVTAENLIRNVDLANVFSQYGVLLATPLEETLKQLKKYTETDSFKARSFQDQKTVYDTITNIEGQLGSLGGVSFREIGQNLYEYNNALVAYRVASEELAKAAEESINAREAVNRAEQELAKATTDEAIAAAKRAKSQADSRLATANQNYTGYKNNYDNAQNRLVSSQAAATDSLRRFQNSIDRVGKVASAVAGGSMRQLWDALGSKAQRNITQFISGTRSYNKALALATTSLSSQGKGMDFFVEKIQNLATEVYDSGEKISESGIGERITALFDQLFGEDSGKMKALGNDVTKILDKVLNKSKDDGKSGAEAGQEAAKEITKALAGSGGSLWTMIIGLILDLLDVLSEGIGNLIDGLLVKVANAIDGILTEIGNGQFFVNIAHGVGNVISGIIRSVGNLFTGGWAFGGGNVDEMEEEIAELAKSNEALAKSIDSLAEVIKDQDSTNAQSEDAYRRALEAEKEWEANQRRAIDNRASEWSNSGHGFLGLSGKHSFNSYVNDRGSGWYGWSDFNRVLQQNGYNTRVLSAGDLWNLSPEMMKLLRDYAPAAWAELLNTDGESNPSDLINEYIEKAGKIDELTSALNEKLTGYSWDSFKGSYVDMLKNLDSTNEDFANNLEDMLTNAILNSLVNDVYKDRIKKLYKMIAEAAGMDSEGGSTMTKDEVDAIRAYNEQLASDMRRDRDALISAGVIKNTGDGSSSKTLSAGIKGISEGTADLLAAYTNGIRADVSVIRALLGTYMPLVAGGGGVSGTSGTEVDQTSAPLLSNIAAIQSAMGIDAQNYHQQMLQQMVGIVPQISEIAQHTKAIMETNSLISKMMERGSGKMYQAIESIDSRIGRITNGIDKIYIK